jgi:protein-S-isoprenylcysteine O-methyltransferase Ste14
MEPVPETKPQSANIAGVVALPPVLYTGTLLLALALHWLFPIRPFPAPLCRVLGAILILVSGALAKWGEVAMHRAGTNVRPDQPSTTIVTDGPFRFSRNPLYLSITGLYVGIALMVNALFPFLLLIPLLAVMYWGVILREERYLEAKFGDTYRAYKARVRRWI